MAQSYAVHAQVLKANEVLKRNVDALLKRQGATRKDLADWCKRSESWISKIFGSANRGFPLKYYDRMADFLGVATYQLFQPGFSRDTERRSGRDRRSGEERRIGAAERVAIAPIETAKHPMMTPADRELLDRLHTLPPNVMQVIDQILKANALAQSDTHLRKKTLKTASGKP